MQVLYCSFYLDWGGKFFLLIYIFINFVPVIHAIEKFGVPDNFISNQLCYELKMLDMMDSD